MTFASRSEEMFEGILTETLLKDLCESIAFENDAPAINKSLDFALALAVEG